jgi:hypothetical protein
MDLVKDCLNVVLDEPALASKRGVETKRCSAMLLSSRAAWPWLQLHEQVWVLSVQDR